MLPRRLFTFKRVVPIALLVVVATGYLALQSNFFLTFRQDLVADIIADSLGYSVTVDGPVSVNFSNQIKVEAFDAHLVRPSGDAGASGRAFKNISFQFPYGYLLGTGDRLSHFHLSGTKVELRKKKDKDDATPFSADEAIAQFPGELFTNPVSNDIQISNVELTYVDDTGGWNEQLLINNLSITRPEDSRTTNILISAIANGAEVSFTGTLKRSEDTGQRNTLSLQATLEMPGSTTTTSGTIDIHHPVSALDLQFQTNTTSIGDFLDAVGIAREVEGTANVQGAISGALDALKLSDLVVSAQSQVGNRLTLSGEVSDLVHGQGVALGVDMKLAPVKAMNTEARNQLVVETQGFSFHLTGRAGELSVSDAHIRTNVAALDLGDFGPITVDRVVKRPDDGIALEGIHVRHGPTDKPYLILDGRIGNLLDLSEVSLAGDIQVPSTKALEINVSDPGAFGYLTGKVAVSDKEGWIGVDEFSATVTGTDLLRLDLQLSISRLRRIDALDFETSLDIPDFGAFAKAYGTPGSVQGQPLTFDGDLELHDSSIKSTGTLTAGKSSLQLNTKLSQGKTEADMKLVGAIRSPGVALTDFTGLMGFMRTADPLDSEHLEKLATAATTLHVDIDLDVKKLITDGKQVGNLTGKATYEADQLSLSKLVLTYLGGSVSGDFLFDLSKTPALLSAKGRVDKLRLNRLLGELGLTAPFTSTVYLSFDVKGAVHPGFEFLKGLTGRVTGSLWGGVLPTRILDLTGLNLVTWLFSNSSGVGTSKLVCAVIPLKLKNGRATTSSLIVETENVQIVGGGTIDLRTEQMNLSFIPRPKRAQVVDIITPFSIKGKLGDPSVVPGGSKAGRVVSEVVALPFNLIGRILGGDNPVLDKAKPCRLPKTSGAK